MIKELIALGVGAAAGFGCGYLYFKKKYEQKADEEIESVKSYYAEKFKKEKSRIDKLEEDSKAIDNVIKEYSKTEEHKKINYHKPVKEEEEIVKAEAESPEEDEPTKPYLITEEEFLNDKNEYDKISLTYYSFDDVLADECDEMIDIEENISSDIYNQIASSDEDLYVRNNVLQTDFEIMKVDGSFHDKYGGF